MIKFKFVSLFLCFFVSLILTSCLQSITKSNSSSFSRSLDTSSVVYEPTIIKRIDSIDDPYSTHNMEQAVKALLLENVTSNIQGLLFKLSGQTVSMQEMVAQIDALALVPNHKYIRFLPKGKLQRRSVLNLQTDSLVFSAIPLDLKKIDLEAMGDEPYVDPLFSAQDSIIPYYAVIPNDFVIPDSLTYQVIRPIFLPRPPKSNSQSSPTSFLQKRSASSFGFSLLTAQANLVANQMMNNVGITADQVEMLALYLAGDLEELLGQEMVEAAEQIVDTELATLSKKAFTKQALMKQTLGGIELDNIVGWGSYFRRAVRVVRAIARVIVPVEFKGRGSIKYQDDSLKVQPVIGVRVTGGYRFYWRSTRTDHNGAFSIPEEWRYNIHYKIQWDDAGTSFGNSKFQLQRGFLAWSWNDITAKYSTKAEWNPVFDKTNHLHSYNYSVVFTAAYTFFHREIDGLPRPYDNWYAPDLDIAVYHDRSTYGDALGTHSPWNTYFGNTLEINSKNKSSQTLYALSIHELAHSAHYDNFETKDLWEPRLTEWDDIKDNVKETFANGVEWYLTNKHYKDPTSDTNKYTIIYAKIDEDIYGGLVQDLIDENLNYEPFFVGKRKKERNNLDKVKNFTIGQIWKAVRRSETFSKWKDYLQRTASGTIGYKGQRVEYTKMDLDSLFHYWDH